MGIEGTERYTIDWKYTYTIDGAVGFSYSCLAELPNGHIGLLCEKYDSWAEPSFTSRMFFHLKAIPLVR
jgi:sialidase-1